MGNFIIILILTTGLVAYGVFEYFQHQKYLNSIPVRIHVNGTRGKSSVTRLIGAGLRAGGYNTITKVTGTFPRMVLGDGTEVAIHRKEKANILEQLDIVKFCAKHNADVLLIECMALQPNYQRITEHQMVHATHGIITNIRLDHLDVMGPGLKDVAKALSLTIPKASKLFTAEDRMLDFLKRKAGKLNTEVTAANADQVSHADMQGFAYFEHPENVALALSVCDSLKVDRKQALAAMKKTAPDEGALKKFTWRNNGQTIHFYNALAANDPESSVILWNNIRKMEGDDKKYAVVINNRKDRKERSAQLVQAAATLNYEKLFLTGENVDLVKVMALKNDIPADKIYLVSQKTTEQQVLDMAGQIHGETVMVAFGNMGAGGAELAKYFEQNANDNKND